MFIPTPDNKTMSRLPRNRFWSRCLAAAGTAVLLGTLAAQAPAQPREHPHEKPSGKHHDKRHGARPGHPHGMPPGHRPEHPGARPPGHRPPPQHLHGGRGAGPAHDWYRGGHVPPMYRSRHYVVNDWRHHHLAPPPRGYHWVQYGGDYVLIAVGTGLIAQIVLSH